MSGDATAPRPSAAAVCERHGLRFDPTKQDGCVLCRRERAGGETLPTAPRGATPAANGRAWAVAALLWVVGGGALFVAHREVLAAFAELRLAIELFGGSGAQDDERPD